MSNKYPDIQMWEETFDNCPLKAKKSDVCKLFNRDCKDVPFMGCSSLRGAYYIGKADGTKETNGESMNGFFVGEYIIYQNGDQYELGRIKYLRPDGAFVAYHEGETGARTPYDCMHKLVNRYVIEKTSLGGSYFD